MSGGRELNADVLLEVFFHLPQNDIFEVMLVSRDWYQAVIEGSILWRKLEIVSTWDMGAVDVVDGGERGDAKDEWKVT